MKKIVYFILIVCSSFIVSCTDSVDKVFSESAADRMSDALSEYRSILTSAPNGWLMEYYAGSSDDKIGGFNYIMSFDKDDNVIVVPENQLADEPGTEVKSLYSLIADQGPVLSFNTYNSVFHIFSEPLGSSEIHGMEGDYEFIFMKVSSKEIILKGKKYGNTIRLTPLPSTTKWSSYMDSIANMEDKSFYPLYQIYEGQKAVGSAKMSFSAFSYGQFAITGIDSVNTQTQNIIYTPEGIKFYEPIVIGGDSLQNLKWDDTEQEFVGTGSNGNKISFVGTYPSDYLRYEDYVGKYDFVYNNFTGSMVETTAEIVANGDGESFTLQGVGPFSFTLNYDKSTGHIYVEPQDIGPWGRYEVYMYMWTGGYSFSWSSSYLYEGIPDKENGLKIVFTPNSSDFVGLTITLTYNGSYYYYNYNTYYKNVVMTKQ